MKKLLYSVMCSSLLLFSFSVCKAQRDDEPIIGSTWDLFSPSYSENMVWPANYTFTQTFKSRGQARMTMLIVHMALNQRLNARLVIKINSEQVFDKTYKDLWAEGSQEMPYTFGVKFPLADVSKGVKVGDTVEFQLTPEQDTEVLVLDRELSKPGYEDYSKNNFNGRGQRGLRFIMWGK